MGTCNSAPVIMLSVFLRETSIHGVRYLVEACHPLARAAWAVCIGACVSAAAAIIYLNVRNWENSPAVVTSVQPALVKVRAVIKKFRSVCSIPISLS